MYNYIIVKNGNSVDVNGVTQSFDFSDLITDANFLAVSWDIDGEIGVLEELTEDGFSVNEITDFTPYQPVINRYDSNKYIVKSAIQVNLYEVAVMYLDEHVSIVPIDDAIEDEIQFSYLELSQSKFLKIGEVRDEVLVLTNELFSSNDTLAQIKTRTMMSYNWSSLNSKDVLLPAEEEDLILYNEVLDYLNQLDVDIISNTSDINTLISTQEVMAYNIILTPIPPELEGNSRRALNYLKLSSV